MDTQMDMRVYAPPLSEAAFDDERGVARYDVQDELELADHFYREALRLLDSLVRTCDRLGMASNKAQTLKQLYLLDTPVRYNPGYWFRVHDEFARFLTELAWEGEHPPEED